MTICLLASEELHPIYKEKQSTKMYDWRQKNIVQCVMCTIDKEE